MTKEASEECVIYRRLKHSRTTAWHMFGICRYQTDN